MAARTQVTVAAGGLLQLARDAGVAQGAGQAADATNGNYVADPFGPNRIAGIMVINGDTVGAHSIIIRAGGSGVSASGGANPGVPFEQATVGDLTVSVPLSSTQIIRLGDTDRYTQADGSLSIDWSAATPATVKLIALVEPTNPLKV